MSIKEDNSFEIKSVINFDNAKLMLKYLCENNLEFTNNKLNNTICSLDWLIRYPNATKNLMLYTTPNKAYSNLTERYVHISPFDPCSYIHEVRDGLFAGTNTVELDITAEAVYTYANYISKDIDLLRAYEDKDIYTILPNLSRDEQKPLMNRWLQGWYDESLPYNELFPITAQYLKKHAHRLNDEYKYNSGLFRDIETKNLQSICRKAKSKITNHLHDAVYTTKTGLKTASELYKDTYGKALKYKVHEYKNAVVDVSTHEWKSKDSLSDSQIDQFKLLAERFIVHQNQPMHFDECDVDTQVLQAILAYRITQIHNGNLPDNEITRQYGCL